MNYVEYKRCPKCLLNAKIVEVKRACEFYVGGLNSIMVGDFPACEKCQLDNVNYILHLKENNANLLRESIVNLKAVDKKALTILEGRERIVLTMKEIEFSIAKIEEILKLKKVSKPKNNLST